jgi:RNA polymerase sigma-70 factor (ECF subfamily)
MEQIKPTNYPFARLDELVEINFNPYRRSYVPPSTVDLTTLSAELERAFVILKCHTFGLFTPNQIAPVVNKRHLIDITKSFQSYLFTIAHNLVYDHYRRIGREERLQQEIMQQFTEGYLHQEEGLILKETQKLLEKAIAQLPGQQQLVFRLCKVENKSYEEVSQQLGISTSTINGHIVKASKTVKAYLLNHNSCPIYLLLIAMFCDIKRII